jgi:hypothetical protein
MNENEPNKIDRILDLLLDVLQERHVARTGKDQPTRQPFPPAAHVEEASAQAVDDSAIEEALEDIPAEPSTNAAQETTVTDNEPYIPEKQPSIHLDRLLRRFMIILLLVIVLINIPFNRYGTNLARAVPDEQSLVIRDGLVLKGSGDEIYVLENNHKRWISSLDAFDYYGFNWEQVNVVDDDYLDRFPDGSALSVIMKCEESVHIYAIENGRKRWIKDIPTFEEQGYVWDDVQFVPCREIDRIPDGSPIPPDAGQPPP